MRRKKKGTTPRYHLLTKLAVVNSYTDLAWAEHSAECYASFFNSPVEVFDTEEGAVLCTKFPANFTNDDE